MEFVNIFMDLNNTQITHNDGKLCSECHGEGRIHNSTLVGGGGPNCVGCHNGSGRAAVDLLSINDSDYIHYNLNNDSDTGELESTNRMCWACHTDSTFDSQVNFSDLPDSGHPDGYDTPKNCTDCHVGEVKFNADLISEHYPNGNDLQTTFTCVQCHNNSVKAFIDTQTNLTSNTDQANPDFDLGKVSHYANMNLLVSGYNPLQYCKDCHNSTTGLLYGIESFTESHDDRSCSINACHKTSDVSVSNLHSVGLRKPGVTFDELCNNCHPMTGEMIGEHGLPGDSVACEQCHMNKTISGVTKMTGTAGARNTGTIFHTEVRGTTLVPGNVSLERGTIEYNRSRCTICHDAGVDHNTRFDCTFCHPSRDENNQTWHSTDIKAGGGPNCIDCHNGSGRAAVDVLSMNDAEYIHYNLNNQSNIGALDSANRICWACHTNNTFDTIVNITDLPDGSHPDGFNAPKICTDCHVEPVKFDAGLITEHNPGAEQISTYFTCVQCHNNSVKSFEDTQTNLTSNTDTLEVDFNIGKISHYANTNQLVNLTSFEDNDYCK
ncbi:MAG: hypothetical protein E4G94_09340 [ANME-2 cluster archaeon]|nr:MAG: hypothetical protein E4G94_09340 [ANME-2 cluster archaeon]